VNLEVHSECKVLEAWVGEKTWFTDLMLDVCQGEDVEEITTAPRTLHDIMAAKTNHSRIAHSAA